MSSEEESEDDVPLSVQFPGAVKPFPYPVGTWVAVEFADGIYAGVIKKLYPGEDQCLVEFTDGDRADYDAGQIEYAIQLHKREFPPEE